MAEFDFARSLAAASAATSTALSLRKYQEQSKRREETAKLRGEALDEQTPAAIKALIKADPKNGQEVIRALTMMDERNRDQVRYQSEQTAKQMAWVEAADTEAEKSQRFDQIIDAMEKAGRQDAAQYRGKYSPALVENWMIKALSVDDLAKQMRFGQLKVAEKDGKPVYIQTSPAGKTRIAPVPEGVRPTQKEFAGTASGGGLKASDTNAIHRQATALYGGIIDPASGKVTGLNPDQERNVQAISSRASRIYADGQGKVTHSEAVAEAARELGIAVPKSKPKSIQEYLQEQTGK